MKYVGCLAVAEHLRQRFCDYGETVQLFSFGQLLAHMIEHALSGCAQPYDDILRSAQSTLPTSVLHVLTLTVA